VLSDRKAAVSAIWITGIGLVTGIGLCRESSWAAIRSGRSGLRWLPVWGEEYPGWAGCPIEDCHEHLPLDLALYASREAFRDAGLGADDSFDRCRVATVVGLSKGNLGLLDALVRLDRVRVPGDSVTYSTPPQRGVFPLAWPDAAASWVAGHLDLKGPSLAPIAACATGLVAVLRAADCLTIGEADLAVAGAVDCSLNELVLGAFRRMGVLARVGDHPATAARPWDRTRSGFLVGEGGAVFILERAEHADARGAVPYAVIAGGALGSDPSSMTDLNPDPTDLVALIGRSLCDAEMAPADIDYVNVHGTATRTNDPLECRAIRRAFGSLADSLSCSATKAQIGHLLGAAGAAELAITCLAMRDGFVPPTLNLDDPDPACDLDGTPHVGKARDIRAALKLSIGFGGHLAAVVLRQPEGTRRRPSPNV
jgi:3-oxoacyl-[acyl-carrier-protein] synthase II